MASRPGHPPDLWDGMAAFLRGIAATLPARPRALLVISGHWEEPVPTLNTAAHPGLLFDYYNFPPHTGLGDRRAHRPRLNHVIPAALSLDRWYRARVGGRRAQNKDSYQPPQSLVTSQNFGRLV